jgi:hypothetical protein
MWYGSRAQVLLSRLSCLLHGRQATSWIQTKHPLVGWPSRRCDQNAAPPSALARAQLRCCEARHEGGHVLRRTDGTRPPAQYFHRPECSPIALGRIAAATLETSLRSAAHQRGPTSQQDLHALLRVLPLRAVHLPEVPGGGHAPWNTPPRLQAHGGPSRSTSHAACCTPHRRCGCPNPTSLPGT